MKNTLDRINSKLLIEFILTCKKGIDIERAKDKSIDFIVKANSKTYAIFTRYRNFPLQETKSRTLEKKVEERIENICKGNIIPVIAYVFFDEDTTKIYVIIMTLNKMRELVEMDNEFLNQVLHGMDIKLGIGKSFNRELFQQLKKTVFATEIELKNWNKIFVESDE